MWKQQAPVSEDESSTAKFMTWYVAPRAGEERCLAGRKITLVEDFTCWATEMRSKWEDRCRQDVDVKFTLVPPHLHMMEAGVAGHIILEQFLSGAHVASLDYYSRCCTAFWPSVSFSCNGRYNDK